jgi:hypothetical protein
VEEIEPELPQSRTRDLREAHLYLDLLVAANLHEVRDLRAVQAGDLGHTLGKTHVGDLAGKDDEVACGGDRHPLPGEELRELVAERLEISRDPQRDDERLVVAVP